MFAIFDSIFKLISTHILPHVDLYCHVGAIVVVIEGVVNFYILTPPELHNQKTLLGKLVTLSIAGAVTYFLPTILMFLGNILPLLFLAFIIVGTVYSLRVKREIKEPLDK